MTNAEAWFNIALRPWKPEGSLGRTAQDGHLESHRAPELSFMLTSACIYSYLCYLNRNDMEVYKYSCIMV